MLTKSSASSRAIPTQKLLDLIKEEPVVPVSFGRNKKGMQATEELEGYELIAAQDAWLGALPNMLNVVQQLLGLRAHKQVVNRLVEPWMFTNVLITGTEFSNFFALRDNADAQPEFQRVAAAMNRVYQASEPLTTTGWHTPFLERAESNHLRMSGMSESDVQLVAVGRCARISYLTHTGVRDPQEDIRLAHGLRQAGHWTPFEHVAKALTHGEWRVYAAEASNSWIFDRVPMGNFWGWHPLRKFFINEHDFGRAQAA
jgi:thymidylate synthase ThyX